MHDTFIEDIKILLENDNIGNYNCCEVVQIVLLELDSSNIYNYFTHLVMKNESKPIWFDDNTFLSAEPLSVNRKYKLAIRKYDIKLDEFEKICDLLVEKEVWEYKSDKVLLDDVFFSEKKFIPESDPATSGEENIHIPLEWGLYGSNFMGNYYIYEIFSRKTYINSILSEKDISKINTILKEHNIYFNLEYLNDRIGNIVCKFPSTLLEDKSVLLGTYGIQIEFTEQRSESRTYTITITSEYDGMIYSNKTFERTGSFKISHPPNEYKNTIIITDKKTSLINYSAIYNYIKESNYYSEIVPSHRVSSSASTRNLLINGENIEIELKNFNYAGTSFRYLEPLISSERKRKQSIEYLKKRKYLESYKTNARDKAIQDLRYIINKHIFGDLKEIIMIDPYLSYKDIAEIAFYSEKPDIHIKGLCVYNDMKIYIDNEDIEHELNLMLTKNTDIKLEYRAVKNGNGYEFHDRYLILNYGINKSRVWSIGTSYNSIGKKHHIVQTVIDSESILDVFNDLWTETNHADCILYKNY